MTVVPPGVDVERFRPLSAAERSAARSRFDIPAGTELVVSISRLVPRKGFDVAIRAVAALARSRPRLLLAIAGSGRDEGRLRRLAADLGAPVRFLGRVANDDLPLLYGCADLFTMACRTRWGGLEQEGFGIVFVEAAACGTPQIAGDSGGAAEAVVDGVTGRVLPRPERWSDVAAAIDELLDDERSASGDGGGIAGAGRHRVLLRRPRQPARRVARGVRVKVRQRSGAANRRRRSALGTALFVVTAVLAAVFFTTALQWVGAITALALFAVGVFCFLWSYVQAVQRSRTDEISVASLYFLAGPATPTAVKRPTARPARRPGGHGGGDDVRPPRRSRR